MYTIRVACCVLLITQLAFLNTIPEKRDPHIAKYHQNPPPLNQRHQNSSHIYPSRILSQTTSRKNSWNKARAGWTNLRHPAFLERCAVHPTQRNGQNMVHDLWSSNPYRESNTLGTLWGWISTAMPCYKWWTTSHVFTMEHTTLFTKKMNHRYSLFRYELCTYINLRHFLPSDNLTLCYWTWPYSGFNP